MKYCKIGIMVTNKKTKVENNEVHFQKCKKKSLTVHFVILKCTTIPNLNIVSQKQNKGSDENLLSLSKFKV